MPDPLTGIESRLRACEDALAALTLRIRSLEDIPGVPLPLTTELRPAAHRLAIDYTGILSLTGRTCVVLGGAFLLRALTESGRVPNAGGVGLGVAYAATWLGAAEQAGRRRPISGLFHGLAAVLIGFPLLWESTIRFQLLPPAMSVAAMAALTALALVVACHRDLPALAGLATTGAVVTSIALAVATGSVLPTLIFLAGLATAAWRVSEIRPWPWLKWPAALAANATALAIAARAGTEPPLVSPPAAIAVAVAMMVAVLGMVTYRVFVRREAVRAFDVLHTALTLLVGFLLCVAMAQEVGGPAPAMVRAGLIALAVAAYSAAIIARARLPQPRPAFRFFSTFGLVLMLCGGAFALSGTARDVTFALLAISSLWLTRRSEHLVLTVHGAAYAAAVAISSGVLAFVMHIWFATIAVWPAFPQTGWLIFAAALPVASAPGRTVLRRMMMSASRVVLALLWTSTLAGVLVLLLGPTVAGSPPDPARLAALRTAILSSAAIVLAWTQRWRFGESIGWLAYPILILGAAKLLLEDLRVAPPATLFVALAVYGVALIVTARLARNPRRRV